MNEFKSSSNGVAGWISAVCSFLTLVVVMWGLHPWSSKIPPVAIVVDQPQSLVKVIKLVDETPLALATRRCNETANVWMEQIEKVMRAKKSVKVDASESDGGSKLRAILGPYMPEGKVEGLEVAANGTFRVTFKKDHFFDLPLAESKEEKKFVRILIKKGSVKGKMIDGKTQAKGIPVKIIAFESPHMLSVDPLDIKHDSMVPGVAKMLGVLPSIVAIVCYKNQNMWLMAPQLNGQGRGDNSGLIKDLLKIDDRMSPEFLAKF